MAINFQRLGVLRGEDAQVGVGFERAGEVDQIAVRVAARAASQDATDGPATSRAVVPLGTSLMLPSGAYMNAIGHKFALHFAETTQFII